MSPIEIGYVSLAVLIIIILLGCPVGIAMALVGFVGFANIIGLEAALRVLETGAFETAQRYTFTLIPLFLLMGNLITQSGMAHDLFRGAQRLLQGWQGSLPAAALTASAAFATVSGSSLATASSMTRIAYPAMQQHGVDQRLASGALAAGGTLGIVIPPSIALLLYALITEQSVAAMFIAGILPGLLAYILYLITIFIMAKRWPSTSSSTFNQITIIQALLLFMPAFMLFAIVLGGLYIGLFTPTEAGGVGAFLALLYASYRRCSLHALLLACQQTVHTSATIFVILIGAEIFGFVLSSSQISFQIAEFFSQSGLHSWQVLVLMLLFYIVLGCFIESLAMILLTVPIFYPIILAFGFDPIWFGVIAVVTVELGLITPPVGMNLFMVKASAPQIALKKLYIGVLPFILADLMRLTLLIIFPSIILFLPSLLS